MTPLKQGDDIVVCMSFQSFHCQACRATRFSTVTGAIHHGKKSAVGDGFYQMPITRFVLIRGRYGSNAVV